MKELKLDYCAIVHAQLAFTDLASIAIKIAQGQMDGLIKDYSVDYLNMGEEQDILGNLEIILMIVG